jgi:hypothetical protein
MELHELPLVVDGDGEMGPLVVLVRSDDLVSSGTGQCALFEVLCLASAGEPRDSNY